MILTKGKPKPPKTSNPIKVGERAVVVQGDCLQVLVPPLDTYASLVQGHQPRLAIADPPYNIGYEYRTYNDKRKSTEYLDWCQDWLTQLYNALAKDGTLWLFIGDEFVSEIDLLAKREGFLKRSHVVWAFGFGVACTKNFSRSHTHLLYYTKQKTRFTFNAKDPRIRVPSNRLLVYKDKRGDPDGKLPDNTWVLTREVMTDTLPKDGDTWYDSRICGTYKERAKASSNQLPESLIKRIVLATSNEGDLVLDPMMGSGTVGAVALKTGRRFAGIDIDKECVTYAKNRLLRSSGDAIGILRHRRAVRDGHVPASAGADAKEVRPHASRR